MELHCNREEFMNSFRQCIAYYEQETLTSREIVNKVLLDLTQYKQFDLVEDVVRLLPRTVRDELRAKIHRVLEFGEHAFHIIGRATPEWWEENQNAARTLCRLILPILDSIELTDNHQSKGF